MRRVLCLAPYPTAAPSVYHRVWAYRDDWAARGVELTVWSFMTSRFYSIRRTFGPAATLEKVLHFGLCLLRLLWRVWWVRRFDALIIHREAFPLGGPLFERLAIRWSRDSSFDLDDAMWHSPSDEVNQRAVFSDPERLPKIMAACTRVVAGNDYIADYARRFNDEVVVVPTAYDDLQERASREREPNAVPVVVWIGNLGNAGYVREVLPALERACAEHPFRLRLIGGEDIRTVESDVIDVEWLDWARDGEAEWLCSADVGIMPLHDREFERGKCAFKIIQYLSAGLPVIASDIGMNRQVVEDGANGCLVSDLEGWRTAVSSLVGDRDRRQSMASRARATYLSRFTRRHVGDRWLELWDV